MSNDDQGPRPHRVDALGLTHLLVTFDEAVIAADPTVVLRIEQMMRTPEARELSSRMGHPTIVDIAPAEHTLLIGFDSAIDRTLMDVVDQSITQIRSRLDSSPLPVIADAQPVLIPVSYTGVDLDDVARECNLSVDAVIAMHTSTEFTVAFCGFAPGFAYLVGLPHDLHLRRRTTPRTKVPAGSVAIAEHYSAVYPRSSPGGWHLLGHTDRNLFDTSREQPALLTPGATVRFRPENEHIDISTTPELRASRTESTTADIRIVEPGVHCLIEDLGRRGWRHLAVGESGAWDRRSHRLAQRLVGNDETAAGWEVLSGGLKLQALNPLTVAITGAPGPAWVIHDGRSTPVPSHTPVHLGVDEQLHIGAAIDGVRRYVAVRGGIGMDGVLGSRSTDTLSGLGPPPMERDTQVRIGVAVHDMPDIDVAVVSAAISSTPTAVEVIPTPLWELLTPATRHHLATGEFTVSPDSNRIGVRLTGPPVEWARDSRPPTRSAPMVRGAIQVPPDGQPVILGPDHPVTGGYPVIGVLIDPDLPAQWAPGVSVSLHGVIPSLLAPRAASSTGRAADS